MLSHPILHLKNPKPASEPLSVLKSAVTRQLEFEVLTCQKSKWEESFVSFNGEGAVLRPLSQGGVRGKITGMAEVYKGAVASLDPFHAIDYRSMLFPEAEGIQFHLVPTAINLVVYNQSTVLSAHCGTEQETCDTRILEVEQFKADAIRQDWIYQLDANDFDSAGKTSSWRSRSIENRARVCEASRIPMLAAVSAAWMTAAKIENRLTNACKKISN
jgi:hypothetical protein